MNIIELARRAGVRDDEHRFEFSEYKYLEAFAKLVAAHEREACAKIAEIAEPYKCADLIRARGDKHDRL
jgi:hypothetical protein